MQVKCPKAEECKSEFCPHVKLHEYDSRNCSAVKDCPDCVPHTSTLTTKSEYEVIKPVSIKILKEAGMPRFKLWRFTYNAIERGYTIFDSLHLNIVEILACASQIHGCLDWLLNYGFIREKEEQLKPCPKCGSTNLLLLGPCTKGGIRSMDITCGCGIVFTVQTEDASYATRIWNERC